MSESGALFNNESDAFVFADEDQDQSRISLNTSWKVLIVDDEEDVHRVTKLVLSDLEFTGKSMEFYSCYSGKEAREFLKENRDIAVILLDVVMEEDDSGLKLVKYIRDEINNNLSRIILRTGQPGQAPEQTVIVNYDINDYKAKTELTSEKLFTTMISALRSYRDVVTIEKSRKGLEKIIDASANIFELQSMKNFVKGILLQFVSILGFDNDAFYCQTSGLSAVSQNGKLYIVAATGKYDDEIVEKEVHDVLSDEIAVLVDKAFRDKVSLYERNSYIGYYKSSNNSEHIVYIEKTEPIEDWEKDMIEIFNTNISVAFENIYLNQELENLVEKRTAQLKIANSELQEKNNLMKRELETAKNVQESMIPKIFKESQNFFIDGRYYPMQSLGGDYYDVFYLNENMLGLVIADVSGHGVSAALVSTMAKMSFSNNASPDRSTADVMNTIHKGLYNSVGRSGMFMTAFYAIIDLTTLEMEYSSGGHNEVIILKKDGTVTDLESLNTIVGIFEEETYTSKKINITEGDRIILYTDGIIEAKNESNEFLGSKKFHEMIKGYRDLKTEDLIEKILSDLKNFTGDGEIDDDRTILVAEIVKKADKLSVDIS